MTEQEDYLRLRQHNLKTMRSELARLRLEYIELFKDWLKKRGEYVTDTKISKFKFFEKALEYKELNFKMLEVQKEMNR